MNKRNILILVGLIIIVLVSICYYTIYNETSKNDNEFNDSNNSISDSNNTTTDIEGGEGVTDFTSKINIEINGKIYSATIENNETTRELVTRLPLEISMKELNGNEKYYYFNDSLPNNPTRVGKINTGDIMLYGDDCLVLFYDTFNTSYTYTKIGVLDNVDDLKNIVGNASINVTISK